MRRHNWRWVTNVGGYLLNNEDMFTRAGKYAADYGATEQNKDFIIAGAPYLYGSRLFDEASIPEHMRGEQIALYIRDDIWMEWFLKVNSSIVKNNSKLDAEFIAYKNLISDFIHYDTYYDSFGNAMLSQRIMPYRDPFEAAWGFIYYKKGWARS